MKESKSINTMFFLCGLLTIAFAVLKLIGTIQWSWVWVLSPLWIYVLAIIAIVFIVAIVEMIK